MFARFAFPAILVAMAGGLVPVPADAQEKVEPEGVVAYRIAVMRTLGAQMMAIKTTLTETPEFGDNLLWHGRILDDASKILPDLFPEGSNEPPSNTLPAVWEKKEEFRAAAEKMTELTAAFLETARGGDPAATMAAFARMGKQGCGGCHESFRKKR